MTKVSLIRPLVKLVKKSGDINHICKIEVKKFSGFFTGSS